LWFFGSYTVRGEGKGERRKVGRSFKVFTRRLICLSAFICYAINFITNIRTHTHTLTDGLIKPVDTNHIKVYVNTATKSTGRRQKLSAFQFGQLERV